MILKQRLLEINLVLFIIVLNRDRSYVGGWNGCFGRLYVSY